MLGKLSRFASLFKIYRGHAFTLILNPFLKKEIWIPLAGQKVWMNFDNATYYHLTHSIGKLERLANAIPDGLDGAIIDGGANHGLFSLLAANRFPEKKIYAIEPYPRVLQLMERNLKGKNVKIIGNALSSKDGEIVFYSSPSSDQLGSLIHVNVKDFLKKGDQIVETKVRSMSLSSLVEEENIDKIAVLKLDVQGAEFDIIRHADEVLEKTDCLILEVMLIEKTAIEVLEKAKKHFPYYKVVNQVSYGADLLFSKKPLD